MPASGSIYGSLLSQAFAKNVNLTSDTLKMALLGAGYTPNLVTDIHWSDVQAQEIAGTGYTAGGITLTSVALTLTAANSWSAAWVASTAYAYGQIIRPATGNGFLYRCVVAGTSSGTAPTWPTVTGTTVTDGTVTWATLGASALVLTSATPQWTGATLSTSYAVIYDAQSGTASTEPLVALQTFGTVQSPSSQTFQVIPDATLGWAVWCD